MLRTAVLAFCLLPALALGDEATIRRVLESKLGGAKIEAIQPAALPGLYEVSFRAKEGAQVVYTDANANYIFSGKLYDLRRDRNLTEERLRKLNAVRFDALPLAQAVKIQRGNGKRVMAMFSDPYCPYCQQFEKTLAQIDDITVYVFMYPVIRPELAEHSKAVWCAQDRSKAWLDLALRAKPVAVSVACETPVEKNLELGRGLGVNSTPTLIFASGERIAGGLSAADLREMLDSTLARAQPASPR